ncbi:hypothetical protein CXB51_002423 [Gossypium anomalum]|uniref:Uncharacterized protein n=1 Tax=Gossypium anomalum TaxID=47600 RepID=A0A8J5ZDL5_9ROSI|nr:hypothetical protein CXB51_002423 [Gossypium anomalum]
MCWLRSNKPCKVQSTQVSGIERVSTWFVVDTYYYVEAFLKLMMTHIDLYAKIFEAFTDRLVISQAENSLVSWVGQLFNGKRNYQKLIIIVVIWVIWFSRNRLVHERKQHTSSKITTFVLGYARELETLSPWGGDLLRRLFVWVNFDAGFYKDLEASSTCINIRNSERFIMETTCLWNRYIFDVLITRALARTQAIEFTQEIEDDSSVVIKKLKVICIDRSMISIFHLESETNFCRH